MLLLGDEDTKEQAIHKSKVASLSDEGILNFCFRDASKKKIVRSEIKINSRAALIRSAFGEDAPAFRFTDVPSYPAGLRFVFWWWDLVRLYHHHVS